MSAEFCPAKICVVHISKSTYWAHASRKHVTVSVDVRRGDLGARPDLVSVSKTGVLSESSTQKDRVRACSEKQKRVLLSRKLLLHPEASASTSPSTVQDNTHSHITIKMGSTTMTAWAVTKVHSPLTKLTEEIPAPTGTEVLIKVTHCGVCHSDLHNWEGFYDMGDGKKLHLEDRTSLPVVLGHEVLGRVQSMGPEAAAMGLKEGDSRLVYPWIGCRNCDDCANDKDDLCMKPQSMGLFKKGGFSSHMIIPHPKYLVDYGNIAPEVACTFSE